MKTIILTDDEYALMLAGLLLAHDKLDDLSSDAANDASYAGGSKVNSLIGYSKQKLKESKDMWALRKKIIAESN